MLILDTNVISELMLAVPRRSVLEWADKQAALWTTSITEAELLYGVGMLPKGKRRTTLATLVNKIFTDVLEGRVLPFDSAAAAAYAELRVTRTIAGRPISAFDAQIAAIARVHGATVATRNTNDFANCGIDVVDPWTD